MIDAFDRALVADDALEDVASGVRVADVQRRPFVGRALVVAWTFPPVALIGTFRTLRFVRELTAAGGSATVISATPDTYASGTPLDPALIEDLPQGLTILRAPIRRLGRTSPAVKRAPQSDDRVARRPSGRSRIRTLARELTSFPDKEIGWLLPAIRTGVLEHRRRPADVLYSSAPPWTGQLVALAIARITGLAWVADFRDPWARAPWRDDRPVSVRRGWAVLERHVIRRANMVLFATNANRDEYAAHYGSGMAAKFHVVPNGCDPEEFVPLTRRHDPDMFVLLHAGSLYGARSPVTLFRAIASAVRRGTVNPDRFRLRLLGTPPDDGAAFVQAATELGVGDLVEFCPRLPRQETLQEMADASCLLVLQPGTTMSIPGKVYEYLAVGRPILAIAEEQGETADLVRRSGIGVSVPPHDDAAIDAAFDQMLIAGRRPGRARVPVELYDGNVLARQALVLVNQAIATRRRETLHGK